MPKTNNEIQSDYRARWKKKGYDFKIFKVHRRVDIESLKQHIERLNKKADK